MTGVHIKSISMLRCRRQAESVHPRGGGSEELRSVPVAALALVSWHFTITTCYAGRVELSFERYRADRLATAQAEQQPIIVLFDANWCSPCRVMEATTFRDPRVVAAATRFVLLEADLSKNGPISDLLRSRFEIEGTPTFLFFDSRGQIAAKIFGGIGTDRFLQQMRVVPQ